MHPAIQTLKAQLEAVLATAVKLAAPAEACHRLQKQGDLFPVMEWAISQQATRPAPAYAEILEQACLCLKTKVYAHPHWLEQKLLPLLFGTGGHRGEIGSGLTLIHVHAIVQALLAQIKEMSSRELLEYCGASSLEEVKQHGIVLGHDNRLFNKDFAYYAAWVLSQAGFQADYVGCMASPQLSLLTPKLGWAGALNFTPSHNPFRYGGIKYSPADGGLASTSLTNPLTERANHFLQAIEDWPEQAELQQRIKQGSRWAKLKPGLTIPQLHDTYLDALVAHPAIRLKELILTLREEAQKQPVRIVVNPTWGATVPVYKNLQKRLGTDILRVLHTDDNPFFNGQNTEPNPATLQVAIAELNEHSPLQIAVCNDPDGDRGLVGDAKGAISMNRFSGLVLKYLLDTGNRGALVTSYATSHFTQKYAKMRDCPVHLAPTGFKNFSPYLKAGALMAYEESNGITIANHTLDKDGVLSVLLATRIALYYQQSLSTLMESLEKEVGKHYWHQMSFAIELPVTQIKAKLKLLDEIGLGASWNTPRAEYCVKQVFAQDGYKFEFEDGTWLMLRPSGTEPKMRVYAESTRSEADTLALCQTGKQKVLDLLT